MPVSALQEMGLEQTLERVNVPSYVIDTSGVVRWLNPAAEMIVGDVRGRQFTTVVAPEDTRRARELFARRWSARSGSRTPALRSSTRTALDWLSR